MAAPKRTPSLTDAIRALDGAKNRDQVMLAMRQLKDIAVASGVDVSDKAKFPTLQSLADWARQQSGGGAAKPAATPAPAPQQDNPTPARTEAPANVEDIPVDDDTEGVLKGKENPQPPKKRGGGRTSAAQENKNIHSFLIANGMDKKAVDKMNPQQRKAAREKIVNDAKNASTTSSTDTTVAKNATQDPPATKTELAEPPKGPIKVGNRRRPAKGGNEAQAAAADKIAPPQKKKAAAVEPAAVAEDDGPDPDLVPVDESNKGGLLGKLRGKRAADWSDWASSPTKGLPEKIPLPGGVGEINTPYWMRGVKETGQYVLQNPAGLTTLGGLYGAYKLGGPVARAMLGLGGGQAQQQQQQPGAMPSQMAPPDTNPNDYWKQYRRGFQQPQAPAPQPKPTQSGGNWWDNEVDNEIMSIPAGPAMRSEDTIRRFRGTV